MAYVAVGLALVVGGAIGFAYGWYYVGKVFAVGMREHGYWVSHTGKTRIISQDINDPIEFKTFICEICNPPLVFNRPEKFIITNQYCHECGSKMKEVNCKDDPTDSKDPIDSIDPMDPKDP